MEFQIWIKKLNEMASRYGNAEYVSAGNEESWRGYFDDKYSPEEAYKEDCSYG